MMAQLPEQLRNSVDTIRREAKEKYGRDPQNIKIIAGVAIIVAETDELAKEKQKELLTYGDREGALALFGGWTGCVSNAHSSDNKN